MSPGDSREQGRLDPEHALREVAASLREPETVISRHVREPEVPPVLGVLAGSGPKSGRSPGEYAAVVESILEGYLLHHAVPRVLTGHDGDLALLAGDYLYALGLERLSRLDDTEAVGQLADLVSLAAAARSEGRLDCLEPLWLAGAVAVACGRSDRIEQAKKALQSLSTGADRELRVAAESTAMESDMGSAFSVAANAIHFPAVEGSSLD